MFLHITSLLFFAAAMQGFFLAGVLGLQRRNIQANQILAVWIGVLSLDLLQQIYYAEGWYKAFPQLISPVNFLPLSYGGFLFLYVRCLIGGHTLRFRDIGHFSLFFLGIMAAAPWLLQPGVERLGLAEQMVMGGTHWTAHVFLLLMPLSASIYAVLSYLLLQRLAPAIAQRLSWLRVMLVLNLIIWAVVWVSILIPNDLHQLNMTIIYLLVSLVIYLLGYFSLRQPDIFVYGKLPLDDQPQEKDAVVKYGDNRLPDELREQIGAALETYMQQHSPWRENNLTLAQLAETTGIASHHISQVLNDHHGLSFNDYLNRFRVEAVCAQLQSASAQNILDIALLNGFASKSSFNAIFKKNTGKTPSEYRKQFQS
ncbi:MAG TPA: helix-turn-helix domain-containing protein [Cellvibrio sp.]|nr:helix-turn-helix domain-containing protein [Cellvibrio sp.]